MEDVEKVKGEEGIKLSSVRIEIKEKIEVNDMGIEIEEGKVIQEEEGEVVVKGIKLEIEEKRQKVRISRIVEVEKVMV